MKAIVLGAGGMGVPMAYALVKLGLEVVIADIDMQKTIDASKKLTDMGYPVGGVSEYRNMDADVLVSCAPYAANVAIAEHCIQKGIRYCDLGGNPEVSEIIQAKAKELGSLPVFTDLGLAPGLVNIMAEHLYAQHKPISIKMAVGGLPIDINVLGRLQYGRVFSLAGLRNEYTGTCDILRYGEDHQVEALTELEEIILSPKVADRTFELEAFHTKGGLSKTLPLMKARGVLECSYKTFRFRGHADYLRFLLEDCKMNDVEFETVLERACPIITEDMVLILVSGADVDGRGFARSVYIEFDDEWTAMQKGTSFPTAAMAAIMATGALDGKSVLDYTDVPIEKFAGNLREIGGMPDPFLENN